MLQRLFVLTLLAVLLATRVNADDGSLRIGRITIDAVPVFGAEAARGRFYEIANLLHVQTRTSFLRSFLLFREGDRFDPALLEETERHLRRFDFLESVTVVGSAPHDGVIDIAVVTHDALTTVINADFSNDGGIAAYSADIFQKDLFGSGSALSVHREHGVERDVSAAEFVHPAIFGPYWNLDALLSRNSDGNEEKVAIDRPLASYQSRAAGSALFDHLLRNERIFALGDVASRFQHEHRELALAGWKTLDSDQHHASGIVAGVDVLDDSFAALRERPADLIPAARHFRFVEGGYEWRGFHFLKAAYVDHDRTEEDFNLGSFLTLRGGVSPSSGNRSWTTRIRASAGTGFALSERTFALGQITASTRAPRDHNTVVALDARSVSRFGTRYPQSFVARVRADLGWQLDRDVQFVADGPSGLRAYPDFAFEGSRRLILNVEHRIFLGRELLQLFAPGAALFADSGQAWEGRPGSMKSDAGIGIRLGIASLDAAIVRIDWAYAFNDSPRRRRGPVWSISTAQAF